MFLNKLNVNMKSKCSIFWLLIGLCSIGLARNTEDENIPLIMTESAQGKMTRLPCNVTPPITDDKVALVIWYKEGLSTPIYSFDARNSNFANGSHRINNNSISGRSFFRASTSPAVLELESTKNSDSGVYRCRVDFHKSPTRNSRVQLNVIIPPEKLLILDDKGKHIPHYILGPYNEGSSVNITCVSTGGRPLPEVTWWRENYSLNSTSVTVSDKRVKNVLQLPRLQRKHLNTVFTCQASNNNFTTPISSSVTLDMNLRPLIVRLQGENKPLSANNSYELWCDVTGSRPVPTVTWWKGSIQMQDTREMTSPDGNTTTSILKLVPTIDDKGKYLSCRADQSQISDSGLEHGWKLDIYHIPVVSLEYGTNLNTTTAIREGADVYFECNIKSNPWVYRVSWRHNGRELLNNIAEGIIVANQSLVLQNVSRSKTGFYTCVGSNREGDGESNPVQLDIKFAPICRPGQAQIYNVGREELAKIICEVEANPTDINFTWKFNASITDIPLDIPASDVTVDRSKSFAHYKPMTEHDYGTLLCWGNNEIGMQAEPCVYEIIPAGKPDALTNCTILNQTFHVLQIVCNAGFNGGLPQYFVVEVYVLGSRQLVASIKSKDPSFELKGLEPGIGYDIVLIARNKKGTSNPTQLQAYTLKNPEKQTVLADLSLAYAPTFKQIKPFIGTLLGIVAAILLVASLIVAVVRLRGSTGHDRECRSSPSQECTISAQLSEDITATQEMCNGSLDSIEKNPDIIPQNKSTEDHEDDEKAFEWINNGHSRVYATTALAEQSALNPNTMHRIPFPMHENNYLQQNTIPLASSANYMPMHSTLVPVNSMAYVELRKYGELTYAELSSVNNQSMMQQKPMYTCATLGRPRHSEFKRAEPTIYAQIDLAHHPQMHQTNLVYTNIRPHIHPIMHPGQIDRYPSPVIYSPNPSTSHASSAIQPTQILQTVPESSKSNILTSEKLINQTTRF